MEPDKVERQFQDIRELLDQYPAATKTYGELATHRDLLADRMKKITAQKGLRRQACEARRGEEPRRGRTGRRGHRPRLPEPHPGPAPLGTRRRRVAHDSGVLRREPPAKLLDREIEETTTNNQQRKIGVFFLPPDGLYYYFWKWDGRRDRQETPGGEEKLENTIRDRPQYVRWAEEYNRNVKAIREGVGRERWEAFLQLCRTMQKELDEYRKHWGTQKSPTAPAATGCSCPTPRVLPAENVRKSYADGWNGCNRFLTSYHIERKEKQNGVVLRKRSTVRIRVVSFSSWTSRIRWRSRSAIPPSANAMSFARPSMPGSAT